MDDPNDFNLFKGPTRFLFATGACLAIPAREVLRSAQRQTPETPARHINEPIVRQSTMIGANSPLRVLLALILIATSATVFAEVPDEDAIRSVRNLSNIAIKNHDIDSLREAWLPHLNVTTASGLVASSAEELAQLFTRSFSDPNFVTAERIPIEIKLSPGKTYAAERGNWIGSWKSGSGVMSIEGIYLAQWHKVEAGWRIRSELFVTLSCDGSENCQSLP